MARTASQNAKRALFADYLRQIDTAALPVAAAYLAGEIPGGALRIGWRAIQAATAAPAELPLFAAALDPAAGLRGAAPVTVSAIQTSLAAIRQATGPGATRRRRQLLKSLFEPLSDAERQFLSKLLVGELRQGALRALVLEALADAFGAKRTTVRRAAMFTRGFVPVVTALIDGDDSELAAFGPRIGVPVDPMLAAHADTPEQAIAGFERAGCEWKLDGVRAQVHGAGQEVTVFSRTQKLMALPEIAEWARTLPAGEVILDAEVFAERDGGPIAFQDLISLLSRPKRPDGVTLRWMVFDILRLDGKSAVDEPYHARRALLEERIDATHLVPMMEARTPGAVAKAFERAVEAGHEGVLVKDWSSTYTVGRRGASWRKLKPAVTADLVILAAEWGHGRRRGFLSNLHLGARDARDATRFWEVGKTFKGLTDAMLAELTHTLPKLATVTEGHLVRVRPEWVVEVAYDQVQRSRRYDSGIALRFARVKRFRPDKDATQATTLEALGGGPRPL